MRRTHHWTETEKQLIRELSQTMPNRKIAELLTIHCGEPITAEQINSVKRMMAKQQRKRYGGME